ncbi:MAG: hypothetical protein LW884_01575 [Bacteroidetes bacterium]|jgi:hypothetical protein|nr:hypothetical protein [Bacteroidota bacterium]
MKILLLLLISLVSLGRSQELLDKIQPHLGLVFVDYIGMKLPDGSNYFSDSPGAYFAAISGGVNYVYAHSDDFLSVGIEPNLNFGVRFTDPIGLLVQTPVFITAKIGAGATKFSEGKVGFALGIGGNFTYVRVPFVNQTTNRTGAVQASFLSPAVMGELVLNLNNPIGIRFQTNLTTVRTEVDANDSGAGTPNIGGRTDLDLTNFAVSINYYFP